MEVTRTCKGCGGTGFIACTICQKGLSCKNCSLCTFPDCLSHDESGLTPGQIVQMFKQKQEYLSNVWQQGPPKRKRSPQESNNNNTSDIKSVPGFTMAKSGEFLKSIEKPSTNTLKEEPLDIGVATWNINHFEKAEQKAEVLAWLFRNHPWLDVLVLQEINAKGAGELNSIVKNINSAQCLSDTLEVAYGPLMQSVSSLKRIEDDTFGGDEGEAKGEKDEEGEDQPDEDEQDILNEQQQVDKVSANAGTETTITIGNKPVTIRTYEGIKSFQILVGGKVWAWARPGQMEYYAIVYRRWKVTDCCAFYETKPEPYSWKDGQKHTLYWSKTTDVPVFEAHSENFTKELTESKVPKELTDSFGKLGLSSLHGCKIKGPSTTKDKKAIWKYRWIITTKDQQDYRVYQLKGATEGETGRIGVYWRTEMLPATYRPVIDYRLDRDKHFVWIGVVHTTPVGSGLDRPSEYAQVKGMLEYAGASKDRWIVAGDYYLDLESRIKRTPRTGSRRTALFEEGVRLHNLIPVVSISATNQTRVRKPQSPAHLKDKAIKRVWVEGETTPRTVYAVNKRADFCLCSTSFLFTFAGLLCPRGGILKVDPDHNALNWWAGISDHLPVGGIFCTAKESPKYLRFTEQDESLARKNKEELERAYNLTMQNCQHAVDGLYAAFLELAALAPKLPKKHLPPVKSTAVSLGVMLASLAQAVLEAPFIYGFASEPLKLDDDWKANLPEPDWTRIGRLREFLEHLIDTGGVSVRTSDVYADSKEVLDRFIVAATSAYQCLNLLDCNIEDIDLTPEFDTYEDVSLKADLYGGTVTEIDGFLFIEYPVLPQRAVVTEETVEGVTIKESPSQH